MAAEKKNMSSDSKRAWEESSDFANYFCTYGYIYHQKQMLSDFLRMQCYRDSIFHNKECFQDKVVLDVGTGSGILAIWAAQAGAKKVYAVEATDMAEHARELVKANKLDHVVQVIQNKVEEADIGEKVDIIISEWMGYFLLRESMLDSVLLARDKWLKPGGAMYPSHATMYIAPISDEVSANKRYEEYIGSMDDWAGFLDDTKQTWGVDMSCLSGPFRREQEQYSLHTSAWVEMNPKDVIAEEVTVKCLDILTCTLEDIKSVFSDFTLTICENGRMAGFVGWFDVDFKGSSENPVVSDVNLTTSPYVQPTHWGQQAFYSYPPVQVCKGDTISGSITVVRRKSNERLMNVKFDYEMSRAGDVAPIPKKTLEFRIE